MLSTFTSTDKFQVFWADYLQVSIQCLVLRQWYSKLVSFYDVWVKCAFFLFLNTKPWNLCVRTLRLFINAISHGVLFKTLPLNSQNWHVKSKKDQWQALPWHTNCIILGDVLLPILIWRLRVTSQRRSWWTLASPHACHHLFVSVSSLSVQNMIMVSCRKIYQTATFPSAHFLRSEH